MADVAVFVSYSHGDDEALYGRIRQLSSDIGRCYKSLSGLEVELFLDIASIGAGDNWRERIRSGLSNATILLAFVSPLYMMSVMCRGELQEFVSASSSGVRKLIVPLLLTTSEHVEARFGDDILWRQIISLQYISIHELRTVDPGSGRWMQVVDQIAKRMLSVLTVRDVSIPPPTGPLEETKFSKVSDDSSATFAVTRLKEYKQCAERLTGLNKEYTDATNACTEVIRSARDSMSRLRANNDYADMVAPIVDRISIESSNSERLVRLIDRDIQSTTAGFRSSSAPSPARETYISSMLKLAKSVMRNLEAQQRLYDSIENNKGRSYKLDSVLQRCQSALTMQLSNRGIVKSWIEDLTVLAGSP